MTETVKKATYRRRIQDLTALQIHRMEEIQRTLGINLITCPECGEPQFVGRESLEDERPETCYNCGKLIANDNSPDLFYSGMGTDQIEWKTESCSQCGDEDEAELVFATWNRCDVCACFLCPECAEADYVDAEKTQVMCDSCRAKAITEYMEAHS